MNGGLCRTRSPVALVVEVRAILSRPGVCLPLRPNSAWASATLLVPSLPLVAQSMWSQETLPAAKGIKRQRVCPWPPGLHLL